MITGHYLDQLVRLLVLLTKKKILGSGSA